MSAALWWPLAALFVAAAALIGAVALIWPKAPVEDRRFADPLPWAWRLIWPLVRRFSPVVAAALSMRTRERLRERLGRAGFDRSINPEQFVGGQVIAGIAAASVCAALLGVASATGLLATLLASVGAAAFPAFALRDRIARRRHALLGRLPHDLDLITLSVEAGLNLSAALAQAAAHAPPGPLREEWLRVLRDIHAGQPRHEALRQFAVRAGLPAVSSLVAALLAAERQGASLAPILRAQAEQRRTERFLRAEKLAMEAPVKMLLPLVVCIFPGTFAILLFPVAVRLMQEGVL
ncbi:MAG: type II secretion system F family protein [Burkholderiales bacterium]|nr:type II secretion system F family protein [Burkholderiales bacterium]